MVGPSCCSTQGWMMKPELELWKRLIETHVFKFRLLKLEVEQVDLNSLVTDLIHSVQLAADAKAIALTTDIDPDAGPILGDPDRLRQIILNLLNNALKFTPTGGSVHVRLARGHSHI